MDAFSRIALHEMTHYSSVGPATSLAQQIRDATNADGSSAYDPPRAHGLLDSHQDDNPVVTEINADSYAWMSLDAWISRKCSPNSSGNDWAGYFTQDPPAYRWSYYSRLWFREQSINDHNIWGLNLGIEIDAAVESIAEQI